MRGDANGHTPDDYVAAIREKGAENIEGKVIPDGEYVAEEAPEQLIAQSATSAERARKPLRRLISDHCMPMTVNNSFKPLPSHELKSGVPE